MSETSIVSARENERIPRSLEESGSTGEYRGVGGRAGEKRKKAKRQLGEKKKRSVCT